MLNADSSFALLSWPNLIVCAIGIGWTAYWTRGKWTRILGGLKGAALGISIIAICTMLFGCGCSEPGLVPTLATLSLSIAFFGSDLIGPSRRVVGLLVAASYITFAISGLAAN
jgi:hypothetical protein